VRATCVVVETSFVEGVVALYEYFRTPSARFSHAVWVLELAQRPTKPRKGAARAATFSRFYSSRDANGPVNRSDWQVVEAARVRFVIFFDGVKVTARRCVRKRMCP
jgi:hypothetical protein